MTNTTTKPPLIGINVAIFVGLPPDRAGAGTRLGRSPGLRYFPVAVGAGFPLSQWHVHYRRLSSPVGAQGIRCQPRAEVVLAFWGAGALQNSILVWASDHRRHHRHVDDNELDPYSAGRGLWFSHMGWMLREYRSNEPDFSNARDLQRDPVVMWQHRHYVPLTVL